MQTQTISSIPCSECGKLLTDHASVKRGVGPVCGSRAAVASAITAAMVKEQGAADVANVPEVALQIARFEKALAAGNKKDQGVFADAVRRAAIAARRQQFQAALPDYFTKPVHGFSKSPLEIENGYLMADAY